MTFVNATSTNLFSVNATSTNLITTSATSTNFYSTLVNAITAAFTNFTATNATTTNLIATNATSTNFFSTALQAITAAFTTLSTTGTTTLATAGGRVGVGMTTPNHTLDVNGNIGLASSGYINFGVVDSTSGYGFRDNAGAIEYKNSNGGWTSFASAGAGGGQLLAVFSTSTAGTNITVNFNGSSNSSPSYSGGVLTLPSNASHIVVETWGAGGGGSSGSGSGATNAGGYGGTTCFGTNSTACTSAIISAGGGNGGNATVTLNAPTGGSGGAIGVAGDVNFTGAAGGNGIMADAASGTAGGGGAGGGPSGGNGGGTCGNGAAGGIASGGGGGGSCAGGAPGGSGGGGGAHVEKFIASPSGTYYYTIGAGGVAGALVANGNAAGAGGPGSIIIRIYTSGVSNGSIGSGLTGYLPFYNSSGTNLSATSSIFLSTSGNVGIGTTSPSSKLDVWGNFTVGTSSTPSFFVNAGTGRVGIGTSTPSQALDVNGIVNATNFYKNGVLFSGSGGTPANTIASFNQSTCPTGWILADGTSGTPDLRGIYVRGAGISGSYTKAAGGAYSATFGTFQDDAFQGHYHQVSGGPYGSTQPSGGSDSSGGGAAFNNPTATTIITDGTNGTPRTANETRPASYALIYCMKTSEDADTTSTIWGTSGNNVFLQDISKNVGVGTVSPTSLLTVASSTATGTSSLFSIAASATLFNALANGNIGIGTSTPGSKLDVWGNFTVGTSSTPLIFANTATGNVGVGTANPQGKLQVEGSLIIPSFETATNVISFRSGIPNGTNVGIRAKDITGSTNRDGLEFLGHTGFDFSTNNGSTRALRITQGGDATLIGTLTQNSDQRLKTNITPLPFSYGLDSILQLNPVSYTWKDTNRGTSTQIGFLAQQVQGVFPELVTRSSATTTDTPDGTFGLNYIDLIAPTIKALQDINSVFNASNALNASSTIFSYYQGTTSPAITVGTTGNVAIATSSSMYALTVGNPIITGVVARFQNATGYCDINPTTTSLTCSSDERLKKNILSLDATSTFDKFIQLNPVTYNWTSETSTSSTSTHAGFIAQQVEALFPDLVATDDTGMKSVSYAGFIPYIIQSIKEIIATLSSFKESFTTNNVHTKNLCVGETCITEAELKALLQQSNVSTSSAPAPTETSTTTSSVVATTTDEIIIDETATSTTETSIEPLPEPVVEPLAATSTEEIPTE